MINLEKIKPTTATFIISCICLFFNVELMIFLLKKELFMTLDIVRLIGIGIGLTSPILVCNGVIATSVKPSDFEEKKDQPEFKEEREKFTWGVGAVISIFFVSFVTLIGHTYNFSLYKTLWILFYFELAFLIISLSFSRRNKRR